MFQNLELFRLAQGMAEHASARHSIVARNIANADTPGYRQRDIATFADSWRDSSGGFQLNRTRVGHLASNSFSTSPDEFVVRGASTDPNGNSVSVETEIMKAAQIRQQHELALSVYRSGMSVLRSSLGRR